MPGLATRINEAVANSYVGRRFRLDGSGHSKARQDARFLTEIRAGIATFFAMAYIISVNASIMADSGGTCVCTQTANSKCLVDVDYTLCIADLRRDFISGTALIASLTTFCMGLFANMPIALAPGMGLNAYFAYTVVGLHGSGPVEYRTAVTAICIEGVIFIFLSLLGIRQWLAKVIPVSIKLSAGVGIGLFLTLIGLAHSAGIGAVQGAIDTPLQLAGCSQKDLVDNLCPDGSKMRSPTMWLGICGGFLATILILYRVKGALIAGIILVSIISWPRDTPFTYFPRTDVGDSNFEFFKEVVSFHKMEKTLWQLDWNLAGSSSQFALALVTFLYVDILDVTGTLFTMAMYAGSVDPETQDFEGSAVAYLVDAAGITIGSIFGLSPVTTFIESGAGISEGGKTGLTAMTTGLCFFISVFFAPIFSSIPPWATGCTLMIVGCLMAMSVNGINWEYFGDAFPAFLTMAVIPFSYSIAYGLVTGIVSYMAINTVIWILETVSGGRIKVPNKELREPWTWKVKGGLLPKWVVRLAKGKRDFWREAEPDSADTHSPPSSIMGDKVPDPSSPPPSTAFHSCTSMNETLDGLESPCWTTAFDPFLWADEAGDDPGSLSPGAASHPSPSMHNKRHGIVFTDSEAAPSRSGFV